MEAVQGHIEVTPLRIPTGKSRVDGDLSIPDGCKGMVVFSHGSGTGRRNPRNRALAATLNQAGYATLLLDLLKAHEEFQDESTAEFRFDIPLLARRLIDATEWLAWNRDTASLKAAYFGTGTGSAAALIAAAGLPSLVGAVVSRAGRPDLAGHALTKVKTPTLLITGGNDAAILDLNRAALESMTCKRTMEIIPGAGHLFEEKGALEETARLACAWFDRHLAT